MGFNWKNAMLWLALTIIALVVAYLIYVVKYPGFQWQEYAKTALIIIGCIAGLIIVVWIWTNANKNDDLMLAKEVVHSTIVLRIFIEEYAKANKIPYVIQSWNEDKLVLADDRDLEINNINSYLDPSKETSDHFMTFEAVTRKGDFVGTRQFTLRTDAGEEWIKLNWNWDYKSHTLNSTYKRDNVTYPLSSSLDAKERMMSKAVELIDEGHSPEEVNKLIDPYMKNTRDMPAPNTQPRYSTPRRRSKPKQKQQTEEEYISDFDRNQQEIEDIELGDDD